ncbi:MAG TPA: adenosine deaminase [Actinomycetota bacterium]|nr:adenosine deaminase [Actinomycetota bacterium]
MPGRRAVGSSGRGAGPGDAPDLRTLDLRALPKVELHRHLEGSLRLGTVIELSRAAGLQLPAWTEEALAPLALVREPVGSLEEALSRFALFQGAVRSLEAVRRVTREAVEDLAADGVRLAELRFSPQFLCEPGGLDWDAALEAILQGLEDTRGQDVAVGLVAIASRDYGLESARATAGFALRHREHLVGFDLAGPELGFPPRRYRDVVNPVKEAGLGLTAHYGESGPPSYALEALEALGADRLGHGLSVARDPEAVRRVAEAGVTLEMCPTSNWLTGGVARLGDHPARRLLGQGVRVTLNSDDPGLFGTDLTHEFEVARDELGFSWGDVRAVTANALAASFLPPPVKEAVRARHFGWLGPAD